MKYFPFRKYSTDCVSNYLQRSSGFRKRQAEFTLPAFFFDPDCLPPKPTLRRFFLHLEKPSMKKSGTVFQDN
jgi:hypothetical protein